MILACQNISRSFGEKDVLKNINFHIEDKDKCAIVGINGAGKTTLLRIIIGQDHPDSGQVVISKDVSIGYLSQDQSENYNCTVMEAMRDAKKDILEMREKIRELEKSMQHLEGEELEAAMNSYSNLTTRFDHENGYACESEINGVLKGLGFAPSDFDRDISTLSGGQKMRVSLGKMLLQSPDIIILDEPTNHLDMPSISWLEGYLSSYRGAVMVVSHDRYFIDRICNKIIEIDAGESTVFNGDYSYYSSEKAKIRHARLAAYMKQQDEIAHEEQVIAKLKQFNREKSIKRAESREKKLDKIERIEKPEEIRADMRLRFEPVSESGNDVLVVEDLAKSFGSNVLFENLNIEIKRGEHVALIGSNGTGKTTILKIINRMVPKDAGRVNLGSRVKIGYFDQEHKNLSPDKTVFEEMRDTFPDINDTKLRNVLAAFHFTGDDVFKKIGDLSGGEQGRISLAKLMLSPANFLVLDEPTNHLDIQSKEILEEALSDYEGTLFYVSHDRYFVNKTANRILELNGGQLTNYLGNYDYYEEQKQKFGIEEEKAGFSAITPETEAVEKKSSKEEYLNSKAEYARQRKLQNDIKKVETAIEKTENRIKEIDEEMALPENSTNAGLLIELSTEKETLEAELSEMYDRWDELQMI